MPVKSAYRITLIPVRTRNTRALRGLPCLLSKKNQNTRGDSRDNSEQSCETLPPGPAPAPPPARGAPRAPGTAYRCGSGESAIYNGITGKHTRIAKNKHPNTRCPSHTHNAVMIRPTRRLRLYKA